MAKKNPEYELRYLQREYSTVNEQLFSATIAYDNLREEGDQLKAEVARLQSIIDQVRDAVSTTTLGSYRRTLARIAPLVGAVLEQKP